MIPWLEQRIPPSSSTTEAESNWQSVVEKIEDNLVIVVVVVQDCTWIFVEEKIADNCETEAMVANNSLLLLLLLLLPPSLLPFRMSVVVKAASNLAVSAASVADASTMPVAGETTADNWSAIVATIGNTDCSAATVRRTEMMLVANAGEKSEFADAMIASNSGRVAELGTEVAATAENS